MAFDVPTLTFAGGFVAFSGGVFLLLFWWQDHKAWSAFWWALGNCTLGAGIILLALRCVLPYYLSSITAPILLDLGAVFAFVAARMFRRGSVNPYYVVAGVAVWAATLAINGVSVQERFAAALGVGTSGGFYAAAALEFWLGREEKLRGRIPIIGVLIAYAIALFMLALQFITATTFIPMPSVDGLGVIQFVGLAYALGVTIFLIMMLNDRNEKHFRNAALVDPLTGLSNRRAFMDRAQRVFGRSGYDAGAVALLAFDLDRFKLINDTFGHATGDQVLRVFADVLLDALRPGDIAARIGGEEFVAVVPGAGEEAAVIIAARIRDAFQNAAHFLNGQKIAATVSVGVVTTIGQARDLADILASADAALYDAKNAGRNRVVLSCNDRTRAPLSNVVRIA